MSPAHDGAPGWSVLTILEISHAPTVGFCFLAAATYSAVVLQKPKALSSKQRWTALVLMAIILAVFIAEAVYYLVSSVGHSDYDARRSAVLECLGSILVWGALTGMLITAESVRLYPYFAVFILEFIFDATISLLGSLARVPDQHSFVSLILNVARTLSSLILVINWLSVILCRASEAGTDSESQPLLGDQPNGTRKPNTSSGYGATNGRGSGSPEVEEAPDRNKDIKEKQARRLEEEGGWIGYIKGFGVFMPYLWPKDDRKIMFCLFLRVLNIIQGRLTKVLGPRQLGIITDKLVAGTTQIPWSDVALWTFYRWFGGPSGYGLVDSYAQFVISNGSGARISQLAFKHVINLSMEFHANKESGEIQKAVSQAESLNRMVELVLFQVAPITLDMGISIWYVTHLFDSYMAFIILFMGLFYTWLSIYFTYLNRENRRILTTRARAQGQVVNETLHNWNMVFYFNRSAFEEKRQWDAQWSTIHAFHRYFCTVSGGRAIQDTVMTLGFSGCCVLAISQIIAETKPVGNLVSFIMYWQTLLSPIYALASSWKVLTETLIDAERLLQLLNIQPTVSDAPNAKPISLEAGKVEFKNVDFHYDARKPVVRNVNFVVEGGQTVAFVGETGGGKSTMLKLISRAYDVTNGAIFIDGQDLRSVTRFSLSEILGLVPQTPMLFNRSIRENVRYARLDATDAEIEQACRSAAIHDTIVGFPDGYNSKVGERGVKLSGGQLQRIAIAQVLLRNPKIVLLDEATSAVDSTTEELIQEAFNTLSAGRTTFVVAHRLSTVAHSDQIIVVDKGEIIEMGDHTQLLERGGKYAELWAKQTSSKFGSKAPSHAGSTNTDDESVVRGVGSEATGLLVDVTTPDA